MFFNRKPSGDYETQRKQMVQGQIASRDVSDPDVLKAIETVPRHEFVPEDMRAWSYQDRPLPIGAGQTISQPYIVAFMSELLEVSRGDRVLEIGTGCGYQTAVLAELGAVVYSLEIVEELSKRAAQTLPQLGYDVIVAEERNQVPEEEHPGQIVLHCGDGYQGWPEAGPFDRIIAAAAPAQLPEKLVEQLADGGVLIAPVGDVTQELIRVERHGDQIKHRSLLPVRFVPMTTT